MCFQLQTYHIYHIITIHTNYKNSLEEVVTEFSLSSSKYCFKVCFLVSYICVSKIWQTFFVETCVFFLQILRKKKYKGPNFEESYTWPAIIRGCDVVAISHKGNDPMLFIPPLLRFLQYSSVYTSPSLHGPAAVILCPSWRKARHVFTLLEEFKSVESLSPMLLLFGLNTEKAEHLKIQKECMVIVTTPNCLVRLLQFQCHRLVGYCHLILDEVDELFSQAFEQISLILDLYKKAIDSEERRSLPQQIIAVGKKWNKKFKKLVVDYMTDPFLFVTLTEEAVLYANVQQVVLLSLDCDKIPHLIDSLDFNPELPQKTLIFTNSSEEADHVFKGNMEQESNKAKSILLLTDKNASHIGGVLQYLERTEAVLPPTIKSFADGVWKAKEFQKRSKPLCKHLKTFEFHILKQYWKILPLYIENASCYFGRIVQGMEDPYEILSAAMSEYYKSHKHHPKTVEVGMLYGIQEKTIFNRVQVLEVFEKEEGIFQQVTIKYIDDGRIKKVQAHNLLNLPSKFQSLHFQAAEIILYGVKPLDNETEWDSMVSTYINKKIRGKLHEADIVLCLGNTIWIDKMVLVTKIPDTKVLINEHVVQSEIIATGLGENNPQHLNLLMSMFHEVGLIEHKETINNLNVHPKIKWYQTEDRLILNVKIMDPQEKNCEFFRNRVIFRAVCGDKVYLADLELHDEILKEKSTCIIKSSETVITLVKQTETIWKQLLRSKQLYKVRHKNNRIGKKKKKKIIDELQHSKHCDLLYTPPLDLYTAPYVSSID
uniref:RNA helicase n=1 Tax=Erpetoichthys calabaricus TaxID=27687 RepID=A0A8C4S4Y5_ERPCA